MKDLGETYTEAFWRVVDERKKNQAAAALGKLGGKVKSERKAEQARLNLEKARAARLRKRAVKSDTPVTQSEEEE